MFSDEDKKKSQTFWHFCSISVVEALQIDLQKNFTLLKEMDGYVQGKPKQASR